MFYSFVKLLKQKKLDFEIEVRSSKFILYNFCSKSKSKFLLTLNQNKNVEDNNLYTDLGFHNPVA